MKPSVLLVLVAAGRGERLGARTPKAWVPVGGRPLFSHALEAFHRCQWIRRIAVVVDRASVARAREFVREGGFTRVTVAAGGARRQDSVAAGVRVLRPKGKTVVLVHDSARPFVDPGVAKRVAWEAARHGAAVAALPASDTLKRAGAAGFVAATVPRRGLWQAQTPQAVRADLVPRWLAALAGADVTDDVQPLEALGLRVRLVPGSRRAIKVTWPEDLAMANDLAGGEARGGIGFDMHRLGPGRPLVLGGVRIPFPKGLHGHSDADIVCHALTDAVLGATAGGDIGTRFGVRRKSTRNLPSVRFLATVVRETAARGWAVRNADVTVLAEAPKLGPYRGRMARALSRALGIPPEDVSVKATTAKKLGVIGHGEAMACFALATVYRRVTASG